MAEQFGTKLNNYTYTLPTGNTISVSAPDNFLAGLKAEEEFTRIQNNFGGFEGLTIQNLGTPEVSRAGSETYLVNNLDVPLGTRIGDQNSAQNTEILQQRGYTVENGVVTKVPPSADPAVKEAFITKLQEHIVGLAEIPEDQLSIYDINNDGQINITDTVSAVRNFNNLSNPEEINNKITSAFSNFVENSPQLSSEAMIKKIQNDIVGLEKISADELDLYDFNNDGSITIQDTVAALRHNQGLETNEKVANTLGSFHQQNIGMQPEPVVQPEPETVIQPELKDDLEDTQSKERYYVMRDGSIGTAPDPESVPRSAIYSSSTMSDLENWISSNPERFDTFQEPEPVAEPVVPLEPEPVAEPESVVEPIAEPVVDTPEPVITPTPTYNIPSTPSFTTQPMSSGTYQSPTVTQPQFTGPVNPYTGTYQLQQGMAYAPSNVQFNVPQIATGVMGQGQATGYNPTLQLNAPQPYSQSGYMPTFQYNEGGMVPNTMQQQPASTMPMTQSTFGGFKPEAMQRIAGSLGYQGDMAGFDGYLNANPDKNKRWICTIKKLCEWLEVV